MVVHEAASSNSAGGRLKATASAVALVALGAMAWQGQPSYAQIAGDPSAPGNQRPVVISAPNGLPLVNIQSPSAGGVSRNTYRQFDVGSQGAILNNSRGSGQTQLGGWVQGNPYMARGSAAVILNEVNSANPSQVRGFVEVAGPRAEIINASRATLTTGVPQFNGAGALEGFLMRGSAIGVEGAGLDATQTDYTAILARCVLGRGGSRRRRGARICAGRGATGRDVCQQDHPCGD